MIACVYHQLDHFRYLLSAPQTDPTDFHVEIHENAPTWKSTGKSIEAAFYWISIGISTWISMQKYNWCYRIIIIIFHLLLILIDKSTIDLPVDWCKINIYT